MRSFQETAGIGGVIAGTLIVPAGSTMAALQAGEGGSIIVGIVVAAIGVFVAAASFYVVMSVRH